MELQRALGISFDPDCKYPGLRGKIENAVASLMAFASGKVILSGASPDSFRAVCGMLWGKLDTIFGKIGPGKTSSSYCPPVLPSSRFCYGTLGSNWRGICGCKQDLRYLSNQATTTGSPRERDLYRTCARTVQGSPAHSDKAIDRTAGLDQARGARRYDRTPILRGQMNRAVSLVTL